MKARRISRGDGTATCDWSVMPRLLCLWLLLLTGYASAETVVIDRVLVHPGVALERPAVEIDPIERARVSGAWTTPSAESGWTPLQADDAGWITGEALLRGYAYAEVRLDEDATWLLEAMGYAGVYVNDEHHIGNVYGYTDDWESWQPHFDFSVVPVRLHGGVNRFLFHGSRYGLMRARLTRVAEGCSFNARDVTLPDFVTGEPAGGWGAIVVVNATGEVVTDATITATVAGGRSRVTEVPALPPYGVRKVGFAMDGPAFAEPGTAAVVLALRRAGRAVAEQDLELAVKRPRENRRVTFLSGIDGSVQYFGYLPATGRPGAKALILSLHGAGVEAINQSGSYAQLSWGHIVAPTNRRPFGFSWEDWGRRDALEVLDLACARFDVAADRIYLTGHSMGGHGAWHLATLHPDRFAAVGPSAGWITIWSYRQNPPTGEVDSLTALVERGTLPSRTLAMAPNLAGLGVYVLHGSDDDNVPPEQAYLMLERLRGFHEDVVYHEEPGAGHWWDHSADPGADCVSWAPMFDFFARHRRPAPAEVQAIDFRTPSPSISAWNRWAGVIAQERPFVMSELTLDRDAGWTRVSGTTRNVAELALDWSQAAVDSVRIAVDGDTLVAAVPEDGRIRLRHRRDGAGWDAGPATDPRRKGPQNNGGFRSAFARRVQLVYGTRGSAAETAWALAKARSDAEWLWYQGNASVDVLPDVLFDPSAEPDRSVVLYGNASTHEDWHALLDDAVLVDRGTLRVGERELAGSDHGVLAVRPRPGSDVASVGLVAATGPVGCRLLDRRPYLSLGVAYPDVTIFAGRDEGPILVGAGNFGNDWSCASGEVLWADGR